MGIAFCVCRIENLFLLSHLITSHLSYPATTASQPSTARVSGVVLVVMRRSTLTPCYVQTWRSSESTKNSWTWVKTPRQTAVQDRLEMICSIGKPQSWARRIAHLREECSS